MPRAPKTVYVSSTDPQELRPPKNGRTFLYIGNPADNADSIYYSDGVVAVPENALEIPPGSYARFERSAGDEVPQGNVWIIGETATRTRVQVIEA